MCYSWEKVTNGKITKRQVYAKIIRANVIPLSKNTDRCEIF